jgi:hypothetical protein
MKRPHKQAEHMAAPTNAVQKLQKTLANGEPSTHGLERWFWPAKCGCNKVYTLFRRQGVVTVDLASDFNASAYPQAAEGVAATAKRVSL